MLENNICTYVFPSFYTEATVATEEGKFDMQMHDCRPLNRFWGQTAAKLRPSYPKTWLPAWCI